MANNQRSEASAGMAKHHISVGMKAWHGILAGGNGGNKRDDMMTSAAWHVSATQRRAYHGGSQ